MGGKGEKREEKRGRKKGNREAIKTSINWSLIVESIPKSVNMISKEPCHAM